MFRSCYRQKMVIWNKLYDTRSFDSMSHLTSPSLMFYSYPTVDVWGLVHSYSTKLQPKWRPCHKAFIRYTNNWDAKSKIFKHISFLLLFLFFKNIFCHVFKVEPSCKAKFFFLDVHVNNENSLKCRIFGQKTKRWKLYLSLNIKLCTDILKDMSSSTTAFKHFIWNLYMPGQNDLYYVDIIETILWYYYSRYCCFT